MIKNDMVLVNVIIPVGTHKGKLHLTERVFKYEFNKNERGRTNRLVCPLLATNGCQK
jgi:hypothetical protein